MVALATAAAEPPQPPAANRVTLMPLWSPQAQFAGYYVGIDKGIYARHGLDVVLLPAGPGRSPVDALSTGKADFAVLWLTTALQRRDQGLPLVNLAQMVQRSSMMLVSKRSSGIRSIADMNGRKVGLWGGDLSIPGLCAVQPRARRGAGGAAGHHRRTSSCAVESMWPRPCGTTSTTRC